MTHHIDPHKLIGCLIVICCAAIVAFILLLILASSANAGIQTDACEAMGAKRCPAELPIVLADNSTMSFLGRIYGHANRYTPSANTGTIIYLSRELNLDRCFGKQYLFHEDVYTVQRSRGYQDEDEAYRLQAEYYNKCMEASHD